ncbi:MAG: F0F1 ATP synthase subunit delta [Candidatus Liptonbacteria bacterium]
MKYRPKIYASALAEIAGGKISAERESGVIEKFLELVGKNGDTASLPKIIAATEKILRAKDGIRRVVLESARELSPGQKKSLLDLVREDDLIEEKINPDLIAGVKVTVDEERQLDFSLRRKLDRLFHY